MLVTLFLVPVGWPGAVLGFFWFRVFDVVKPYPANRFERLPGGVGIMADDFMAGRLRQPRAPRDAGVMESGQLDNLVIG